MRLTALYLWGFALVHKSFVVNKILPNIRDKSFPKYYIKVFSNIT